MTKGVEEMTEGAEGVEQKTEGAEGAEQKTVGAEGAEQKMEGEWSRKEEGKEKMMLLTPFLPKKRKLQNVVQLMERIIRNCGAKNVGSQKNALNTYKFAC